MEKSLSFALDSMQDGKRLASIAGLSAKINQADRFDSNNQVEMRPFNSITRPKLRTQNNLSVSDNSLDPPEQSLFTSISTLQRQRQQILDSENLSAVYNGMNCKQLGFDESALLDKIDELGRETKQIRIDLDRFLRRLSGQLLRDNQDLSFQESITKRRISMTTGRQLESIQTSLNGSSNEIENQRSESAM